MRDRPADSGGLRCGALRLGANHRGARTVAPAVQEGQSRIGDVSGTESRANCGYSLQRHPDGERFASSPLPILKTACPCPQSSQTVCDKLAGIAQAQEPRSGAMAVKALVFDTFGTIVDGVVRSSPKARPGRNPKVSTSIGRVLPSAGAPAMAPR